MASPTLAASAPAATWLPPQADDLALLAHVTTATAWTAALVHGAQEHAGRTTLRSHTACVAGEELGALHCDCRERLDGALADVRDAGAGMLLYVRTPARSCAAPVAADPAVAAGVLRRAGIWAVSTADRALGLALFELGFDVELEAQR